MTDPRRELGILRSMAADLEPYVLSDTLFWSLSDGGPFRHRYPQLTLGGLLLTQAKLRAVGSRLSPTDLTDLARAERVIAALRSRWQANWEKKAEREIGARLNAWERSLAELQPEDYPGDVLPRVMLELLFADLPDRPALAPHRARLQALDAILRGRFQPGPFVLDQDLARAFPPDAYWYLYGRPAASR